MSLAHAAAAKNLNNATVLEKDLIILLHLREDQKSVAIRGGVKSQKLISSFLIPQPTKALFHEASSTLPQGESGGE